MGFKVIRPDRIPLPFDMRFGWALPSSTATGMNYGGLIANAASLGGTISNNNDANGRAKKMLSGAVLNNVAGFGDSVCASIMTGWDPILRLKFKFIDMPNIRFFAGVVSHLDVLTSDTPAASLGYSYAGLFLRTAVSGNFAAGVGNGVNDYFEEFGGGIALDTNFHEIIIQSINSGSKISVKFDSYELLFDSGTDPLPSNSTGLGVLVGIKTLEAVAKSFNFYAFDFVLTKLN